MANPIRPTMKVGTVGEVLVQVQLLQCDVQAAPPIKDLGNDLIALRGFAMRTIQVRTTTDGVPKWPSADKLYHLLAVVRLEGDGRQLRLDDSKVFLVPPNSSNFAPRASRRRTGGASYMGLAFASLIVALLLAGCMTTPVKLRHPVTGRTVQCGPYDRGREGGTAVRKNQCIQDYQRQGYERARE